METEATIVCKLACFSKDIGCKLLSVSLRQEETIIKLTSTVVYISNITGDPHSYNYPSQNIIVTNLTSNNTYIFCVHAYNLITTELLGDKVCRAFATNLYHPRKGKHALYIVVYFYVLLALNVLAGWLVG